MSDADERIKVIFFATLRESIGVEQIEIVAQNLSELADSLTHALGPQVRAALADTGIRLAVNQEFFNGDWRTADLPLASGTELAFLPPVTGG